MSKIALHTYQRVMSHWDKSYHVWMRHVTFERVMLCLRGTYITSLCTSSHKFAMRVTFLMPPLCGVATISRLFKIIGLFCKRALEKRRCLRCTYITSLEVCVTSHKFAMRVTFLMHTSYDWCMCHMTRWYVWYDSSYKGYITSLSKSCHNQLSE